MRLWNVYHRLFDGPDTVEGGAAVCALSKAAEYLNIPDREMRGHLSAPRVEQLRRSLRAALDALDAEHERPTRAFGVIEGGQA